MCGTMSIELWPLTGFRIYHVERTEARSSTAVVAILADGEERSVSFNDLPFGWHLTNRIVEEFPGMNQAERDAVCHAWVRPLRDDGLDVVDVRIDDVLTHLADPNTSGEVVGVAYRCGA